MAFICRDCIEPAHKDEFMYMPLSHGPCENCHYTDDLVDTKAGIDPNWHKNVRPDLFGGQGDELAQRLEGSPNNIQEINK